MSATAFSACSSTMRRGAYAAVAAGARLDRGAVEAEPAAAPAERGEDEHGRPGENEERLRGDCERDRLRGADAARDEDGRARPRLRGRAGGCDRESAGSRGGAQKRDRERERDADAEGCQENEEAEGARQPRCEDEEPGAPGVVRGGRARVQPARETEANQPPARGHAGKDG